MIKARAYAVLAEPHRSRILDRLRDGEQPRASAPSNENP
jgi:hypothetical protein